MKERRVQPHYSCAFHTILASIYNPTPTRNIFRRPMCIARRGASTVKTTELHPFIPQHNGRDSGAFCLTQSSARGNGIPIIKEQGARQRIERETLRRMEQYAVIRREGETRDDVQSSLLLVKERDSANELVSFEDAVDGVLDAKDFPDERSPSRCVEDRSLWRRGDE
jgi:hypothetical protein